MQHEPMGAVSGLIASSSYGNPGGNVQYHVRALKASARTELSTQITTAQYIISQQSRSLVFGWVPHLAHS